MSVWSTIASRIQEILKKMIGTRTIEQTLHVTPAISTRMEEAIQLWSDMYKNQAPWVHEPTYADPSRVVSLGLPSMIASEKARMALIEWKSEITTPTQEVEVENPNYKEPHPDEYGNVFPTAQPALIKQDTPVGDTTRAEYLDGQYQKLKSALQKNQLEYAIAKGGMVIKPYVVQNVDGTYSIEFDYIQADNFFPLAYNASGTITEAVFVDTKFEKNIIYRRLEYHKWLGKKVQVVNKAYKSISTQVDGDVNGMDLGKEVPLTEVPEWKDLAPNTTIEGIDRPLFAYFKVPQANTIDTLSPLGASGYSRAVQLIKDADVQYSRLLWEYEGGELAIDIDRDALQFMEDGKDSRSVPNRLQQRLYRKVDLGDENTYEPFAPSLRDASLINGLNTILMRIEDVCALSRGTISDASAEAKTATELKILKQRTYTANSELQNSLEQSIRDVIYIMNVYCDLYAITPPGEYEVSFEWDDSIIEDIELELGKKLSLMQNGLMSKLEVRQWYFGETERQAEEALRKINEDSLQNAETQAQVQMASMGINGSSNSTNSNQPEKPQPAKSANGWNGDPEKAGKIVKTEDKTIKQNAGKGSKKKFSQAQTGK